jgi:transposase-like protein
MTHRPLPPIWQDLDPSATPCGGPRTRTGKNRSRANATTHGLTATTLLPNILNPSTFQILLKGLRAEWQPRMPTQESLVGEMARHAAALQSVERAEPTVLRSGASAVSVLRSDTDDPENAIAPAQDFFLTAAVASDTIDRVTRYRRAHEKAFYQALQRLREIRLEACVTPREVRVTPPFVADENACREYLVRRMNVLEYMCPRCGHTKGYYLATRERWQCAGCGRQSGLRAGTVMERLPLPLSAWFAAIWQMFIDPDTSVAELTVTTKIPRPNAVRRMVDKIRAAMKAPNANCLLAGLDNIYHEPRPWRPEPGDQKK